MLRLGCSGLLYVRCLGRIRLAQLQLKFIQSVAYRFTYGGDWNTTWSLECSMHTLLGWVGWRATSGLIKISSNRFSFSFGFRWDKRLSDIQRWTTLHEYIDAALFLFSFFLFCALVVFLWLDSLPPYYNLYYVTFKLLIEVTRFKKRYEGPLSKISEICKFTGLYPRKDKNTPKVHKQLFLIFSWI